MDISTGFSGLTSRKMVMMSPTPVVKSTWWTRTRVWTDKHGTILGAICIVLLVILVLATCQPTASTGPLGSMPGVATSPTATDSGSPAPSSASASTPPVSGPAVAPPAPATSPAVSDCSAPQETSYRLSVTQVQPAADLAWMKNLKGTGVTRLVYSGEFADAAAMGKWADAAACSGFFVDVRADNACAKMSGDNATAYFKAVAAHGNFIDWVVSGPKHDQCAAAINAAGTGKTVYTWTDWPLDKAINAPIPIFLPFPEPNNYGVVSDYSTVGHDIFAVEKTTAWAAVQAFDWVASAQNSHDPEYQKFVAEKGFHSQLPNSSEVGGFAQQLRNEQVRNILIYTEEPAADNLAYIADCARAVTAKIAG